MVKQKKNQFNKLVVQKFLTNAEEHEIGMMLKV